MKLLRVLVLLLAAVGALSCNEKKIYKIGVSQCSSDDWRSKMNEEIEREIMFHDDAIVEIRSADDDNARQIADIRYFAKNGFDILIVAPNEAAALTPTIRKVYESGMPVVIFDRNIIGDTYTARIGANDHDLGRSAAEYALHLLGTGAKAIEIYGLRGSTPAEDRHNGFSQAFIDGGGQLLASEEANWNQTDAVRVADSLLNIYKDVDLIFAHNDRMAIGASHVARQRKMDNTKIIGIDAAPEIGIRAVADSIIDATFLYPTDGHLLIRTALAILHGEPFDKEQIAPASSAVDLHNADILMRQNAAISEETDKMRMLKTSIDEYWARHSSQTSLFYACIAIIALLFGIVFLVLRAFWQHKRHQCALIEQNRMLQNERDKQKELNVKLSEATQSKLTFFTNVSHDLRTPLTLISEPVAQLAAATNLNPHQHTLIKIADKNVRVLQRLINQILDFRSYENGKTDLRLCEIDLVHAIADWMESFYALARRRGMRLTFQKGEAEVRLAADPDKIERVFFNLLSNALKYTPENGTITVSCDIRDGKAIFSVADTGRGISQTNIGHVFDRFYQVDRVHSNGSGIGLALTKAFVELHGGAITVASTVNKGSVFTVELPIRHVAEKTVDIQSKITSDDVDAEFDNVDVSPEFDENKPVLLVVDDNKDIQCLITELLRDNYSIICASDGAEALRKAMKYIPDLIICDVMMPVMDGLECCRRLKSEVSTSHIPVLILTACAMDEQRVEGYDSGADGYIAKPFSEAVLRARCASLIANRKRIKELWSAAPVPAQPKEKPTTSTADIDNDFYRRFLEVFEKEIGNPGISVDVLASRMGFERSQFYRKIKALTNYSPVELMRKLRLEHARRLLTITENTVGEIAYGTGFSTPAYFTKCFREAYGQTPTEFREGLRK